MEYSIQISEESVGVLRKMTATVNEENVFLIQIEAVWVDGSFDNNKILLTESGAKMLAELLTMAVIRGEK